LRELTEVYLSVEGFEALRLVDVAGLKHEDAALRMNVSRQTFSRVLAAARKAVAEAVILGQALRIEGGNYVLEGRGPETIRARAEALALRSDRRGAAALNQNTGGKAGPKERIMSKIAVSSEGPTLDDKVDPRFGRAAGFVVVDPATMEFEFMDNGSSQAMSRGAGIQAAELVAGRGVKAVLTGQVGPNAFSALAAAGIEIGTSLGGLSVRQAIERYLNGQVELAAAPTGPGHNA
jgi:predicted Fe-Mo cluster-binding NifX family protein/predicted DNA-binding protein (UPF0251 family)